MTPQDIYLLPSKKTERWYQTTPELWTTLFGIYEFYQSTSNIDENENDNNRLVADVKLDCLIDWGERSASITAISFDGNPFALVATAGRGESDFAEVVVTNEDLFNEAFLYFVSKAIKPQDNKPTICDQEKDSEILDGFYGVAIVKTEEGIQMVREEYVDHDGKLLFDIQKYHNAFDAVRGELSKFPIKESLLAKHAEVREIVADVIEKGFVDDVQHIVINRRSKGNDGDWIAAAAVNDSGTYVVGIKNWNFDSTGYSWGSNIYCSRVGDSGIFEELKMSTQGTISDGMKP